MGDPTKAEQELNLCLNDAESGAQMAYAEGVRDDIANLCRQKFIDNEDHWDQQGQHVRRAARFAGRFAHLFAEFDGVSEVRMNDIVFGLIIMKSLCYDKFAAAAAGPGGQQMFFAWCPDNPGPSPFQAGRRVT